MRDGSLSGCQDIEWNWATGPGWLHLAVGLVLEGGDLLDGHLLLGGGVPGLHHRPVSALAQELGRLVAGSDLQERCIDLYLDFKIEEHYCSLLFTGQILVIRSVYCPDWIGEWKLLIK